MRMKIVNIIRSRDDNSYWSINLLKDFVTYLRLLIKTECKGKLAFKFSSKVISHILWLNEYQMRTGISFEARYSNWCTLRNCGGVIKYLRIKIVNFIRSRDNNSNWRNNLMKDFVTYLRLLIKREYTRIKEHWLFNS